MDVITDIQWRAAHVNAGTQCREEPHLSPLGAAEERWAEDMESFPRCELRSECALH